VIEGGDSAAERMIPAAIAAGAFQREDIRGLLYDAE